MLSYKPLGGSPSNTAIPASFLSSLSCSNLQGVAINAYIGDVWVTNFGAIGTGVNSATVLNSSAGL